MFVGNYVNERSVNYMVKYMTKTDPKHKEYTAKVLCSKGIGANYFQRTDRELNRYKPGNTVEVYRTRTGHKLRLPIYYRNGIYTEEQREALWIEKLDKGERWVMGIKAESMEHYFMLLKEARAKNEWLGFGALLS